LYVSCKTYQELAQARITKVVVYFATNPTKLVLNFYDFSVIFYVIYKNRPNHFTIGVNLLQGGPRKDSLLCNVAPGRPAGAVEQNPASSLVLAAGEGRGKGLGLLGLGLGCWIGRRGGRWWPSAAHRGGCRWSGCSGEGRARSGLNVAGEALVGTHGLVGVLK
jgi:hypothetical protein